MKRLISLLLFVCLCLSFAACASAPAPAALEEPAEAPATAPEIAEDADSEAPVSIMVLNGTTGFGMAKLISDAQKGESALNYAISVGSDASAVTAALISGDCDIAALPTNAAATVYNKTQGGVQLLAINTLGVLYLMTNREAVSVSSLAELAGMTVYVPAQNPTFLFRAILSAAGIEDVTIDNTYAQPADLRTALAAGEVDIAVLPEPMVTIARGANENLDVALDLTAEWDRVEPAGSLVQGCVVVRMDFAAQHPELVASFLAEYEDSIAYLSADADAAGALIEETGVFTNGAVAAKAIPNCNICFLVGADMKASMTQFCEILYALEPSAIGGAIPGEDFYWQSESADN